MTFHTEVRSTEQYNYPLGVFKDIPSPRLPADPQASPHGNMADTYFPFMPLPAELRNLIYDYADRLMKATK